MGEKLVIGPINKGQKTDRTAFNIDNDSFPTMINAYQWRGRVKRKRGTTFLTRLERYFNSTSLSYSSFPTFALVSGEGNLISGFNLESNGAIVPGSVTINDVTSSTTYIDDYVGNLIGGTGGTINYGSGSISINGATTDSVNATFNYYPDIPVMGEEDFNVPNSSLPLTVFFDPIYSYQAPQTVPTVTYDVSFFKTPPVSSILYPGYTPKSITQFTPALWNGLDYQQFWTVNYQGALWATNGIQVPFNPNAISMQFAPKSAISVVSQTATTIVLTILNCPLVIGDFVFLNEFSSGTPANANTLNFQSGYVTACSINTPPPATKTVTITLPFANVATDTYTPGIVQYLTNSNPIPTDCLRWYDGSPTNGANPPSFLYGKGWVNFMPPLSQGSFSISDEDASVYYLVGARMIIPFKGSLLFLGAVIQNSTDLPIYLQDTVVYSQNGTPYYTASFNGNNIFAPSGGFNSILVPDGESAQPTAYWEDQTGFGGFTSAGIAQPINTAAFNEDAIIVGFSKIKTRLAFTGNTYSPFEFFSVNTEFGSSSVFSVVTMDEGVIDRGDKGFTMTSQTDCARIDLENPQQVFKLNFKNNGTERFCSFRDFINEWVYFTYPSVDFRSNFYPNQTFMWNYRDNSFSVINECYTTYGTFRKQSDFTWNTVPYESWNEWNTPWNSGDSEIGTPQVIGGNQQGFVLIKDDTTTGEGTSLYIQSFVSNLITSPNHCLNNNDYIVISGCIGSIGIEVNGLIFKVSGITQNTFLIDQFPSGSYVGGGLITRIYVPFIQTKQFPTAWDTSRKTRLGPQQYLFTKTAQAQITLQIYLSQNATFPYNSPPIVPEIGSTNNSLIYSTVLYTCPESTNLGLTPSNINLQTPTASAQNQIWHRKNTSLIGDTVQLGFTLSDTQIRDQVANNAFDEIELHSCILDVQPSQLLV